MIDGQLVGIYMRSYELSETSLIVYWLTLKHGLIKTVAKGAKNPKNNYLGALEAYTISDLQISATKGQSDLHTLLNASPIKSFNALRTSYLKLTMASYFGSLTEKCVVVEQPVDEIYNLFLRALNYINTKKLTWKAVTHYEKELSKLLGYSAQSGEIRKLFIGIPSLANLRNKLENSL